jgi:hypothetical protein
MSLIAAPTQQQHYSSEDYMKYLKHAWDDLDIEAGESTDPFRKASSSWLIEDSQQMCSTSESAIW